MPGTVQELASMFREAIDSEECEDRLGGHSGVWFSKAAV